MTGLGFFCSLSLSSLRGLSFLDVLRHELLVLLLLLLGGLKGIRLSSLEDSFSADALLSDESLNLGSLVVNSVFLLTRLVGALLLDLTANDVVSHIVLFLVKVEESADSVSSLLTEAVWSISVGDLCNLFLTLFDDSQLDDSEVRSTDASTN